MKLYMSLRSLRALTLIAFLTVGATTTFAAPVGHQICRTTVEGQKIQLIYGTYALSGEAELRIDGKKFEFAADGDANPTGEGLIFTASQPGVGSIQWISTSETARSIRLSVHVQKTCFDFKTLRCRVLDFSQGNEQN